MIQVDTVLQGNKLIGKFMGLYLGKHPYYNDTIPEIYHPNESTLLLEEDMKYHTSWDWLMPVVEKIESLGYTFGMVKNGVHIIPPGGSPVASACMPVKINSVYTAVLDFIEWHNTQNKQ